ncbi:MAG: TonB-dependent receptor [Candidatus Latescibacter sp.]|nr:TonB-dependent receptor [Candidatus Latescibacter sp.]
MNHKLLFLGLMSIVASHAVSVFSQEEKGPKTFILDEIVITATRTERLLDDVPQDVNVITKEEISKTNAQTVGDLLKYVPGLNVSTSEDMPGQSTYQATLRGLSMDNGYGLVLIDSQRVKGRGMGEYGNGLNQIPVEMIERIEIVKGPGSVLYGSDAITGVINIITKPVTDTERLDLYANYGSKETAREGFTYSNRVGKVGFRTSGSMERTALGTFEGRYLNNRFNYRAGKMSYTMDIDLSRITTGSNIERRVKFAPEIKADLGEGATWVTKGYWYDWDFFQSSRDGDIMYGQAETQYTRLLALKHRLTAGGEFLRQGLDYVYKGADSDKTKWPLLDKDVDTWSLYAQDEWLVVSRVFLVLGARFDHHSSYGGVVSPRLSVLFDITGDTRLRASAGRSFKSPTIRQIFYPAPFLHSSTQFIISNPDLKPEYGTGFTLSLEHSFSQELLANIMVYRNDIKDMVKSRDTGEMFNYVPLWTYENISRALTQGVEGEVKFQLPKGFYGSFSFDYTDTENKDTGKKLTLVPDHTEGLQLNYQNSRFGIGVEWGIKYFGPTYTDEDNTKKRDGYVMAEAKIRKTITQRTSVSVEGDNLFDTDYGDPATSRLERTYFVKFNLNQ